MLAPRGLARRWRLANLLLLAVLAVLVAPGGQADETADASAVSVGQSPVQPQVAADVTPPTTGRSPAPRAEAAGRRVPVAPEVPSAVRPDVVAPTPPEEPARDAVAPVPLAAPVPLSASVPVRLAIPSIGVDSELMDLGLQADGSLEVPAQGFPAGWYTGAPTPGELGPAIVAGHVDWEGRPGVFYNLRELAEGDEIAVTRQDGSTARFGVTRVERFAKDKFPTQAVYGNLDHAGLRLITCGGAFDRRARSYRDNIIVFADLLGDPVR